jgi:hypothetical protein
MAPPLIRSSPCDCDLRDCRWRRYCCAMSHRAAEKRIVLLMARWRIDILRKCAEHLGTMTADSEQKAIEEAAKRFQIDPAQGFKIIVQKISVRREK